MARPISLMTEGWNALRRLVEHQQSWARHQSPADRQLLLLAAGQIAAAAPEHRLQHGKQIENFVGNETILPGDRGEPGFQVLLDRQQGKDLAALRHVGDPAFRPRVRRQFADVLVLPQDAAAGDRLMADDGAKQRRLADPVAAEHAGDAAGLRRDGDAAQGLRRAIEEVDAFNRQHASAPPC